LSFIEELKRRNVFRAAIAYLALAWLLIEVAGTLFPAFGIPAWAFRFVVIVLTLGFVPTLVVSWTYEITLEGLKREKEVVRDESTARLTAKRLDWLTISLIVVALVFIVADRLWLNPKLTNQPASSTLVTADVTQESKSGSQYPPNSIAVLPFANRSANPDDRFFVDGIHDDLLTYISQIGSIKTISRTSVMQYRDTIKPIRQIASELEVGAVLEGGVQRAGDQVRINVQLIDARTDDHLWSQIFDRQLTATNIFGIQSEIAEEIARALRATLTPEAQERIDSVPTESLVALEAYFIGRQSMETRTSSDLAMAVEHFEEAITHDPDFALAYVGLADTYLLQTAYSDLPWHEMRTKSQAAADRAIRLDPRLGEAYASLAKRKSWEDDKEGAEVAFKRALELNPNYAPAYQWYGEMLGGLTGRIAEALELSRKAVALDPKSAIIVNDYAEVLENAGNFGEALSHYEKAVEINPGFAHGYVRIGDLKAMAFGRLDEAVLALGKGFAINPRAWSYSHKLGITYLNLGDLQKAEIWGNRVLELAPENVVPSLFFKLHLYRGEESQALGYIRKHLERRPLNGWVSGWGLMILGNMEAKKGNAAETRALYEKIHPELFDDDPRINRHNELQAVALANVLLKTGEQDMADRLLDRSLASTTTRSRMGGSGFGILDARIHALRGDVGQALAALRQAFDLGWREDWWYFLEQDPVLQSLRNEPAFQAMRLEIQTDMAGQLARVQEWEANGDLPSVSGIGAGSR